MSAIVALTLSAGAKTNYDKWLFVNYALLNESKVYDDQSTIANDLFEEYDSLNHLTGQEIVRCGTPFFWMNVFRYRNKLIIESRSPGTLKRYLTMAAFDSYFELLQDGSSFDLDLASNSNIVMPKLGVYIPGLSGKVSLCRTDFHTIMIRTAHKTFSIDRTNIERNFKIPVFEIQGYDELRLLCIRDLSLFEDEYINSINPDVDRENLRSMIAQSLDFISAVNYDLGTRINSLEKWFVPIFTPGPQTHTSFTIQNLSGVLFLSQATDFLRLAEAIVHEFHHAELNLLMVLEKLFDDDNDKRYYSPWRDDPRPLQGLFHGIYVFSELIDFYERAETLSNMQRYLNQIRYRKSELVHRVRIALEQIPYSSLTSTGMKIVESIRSKLDHYDTNAEPLPNHLKNHLVLWKNTNPQLVLKVPKKYHNDISSHV